MKHFILALSCFVLLMSSCKTTSIVSGNIILVRHADRDDRKENLNDAGQKRAQDLADILRESEVPNILFVSIEVSLFSKHI